MQHVLRKLREKISDLTPFCPDCGHPTEKKSEDSSKKKMIVALLLCLQLGFLGAHRFYVGKIGTAILQIFILIAFFVIFFSFEETGDFDDIILWFFQFVTVFLFLGIWVLLDLIAILRGNFRDDQGKVLS